MYHVAYETHQGRADQDAPEEQDGTDMVPSRDLRLG